MEPAPANVDLSTGRLRHVLTGPRLHRGHHATDYAPHGKNFGTKLALWTTCSARANQHDNVRSIRQ